MDDSLSYFVDHLQRNSRRFSFVNKSDGRSWDSNEIESWFSHGSSLRVPLSSPFHIHSVPCLPPSTIPITPPFLILLLPFLCNCSRLPLLLLHPFLHLLILPLLLSFSSNLFPFSLFLIFKCHFHTVYDVLFSIEEDELRKGTASCRM